METAVEVRGASHGGASGLGAGADHPRKYSHLRSRTFRTFSVTPFQRAIALARTLPEPCASLPIACAHS